MMWLKSVNFFGHIINTHKCSLQAAGREWTSLAWGTKSWAGEWRCTPTGRGKRLVEGCPTHISAAERKAKQGDWGWTRAWWQLVEIPHHRLSPWWTGRWLQTSQRLRCIEWWWWSDASRTGFPPWKGKNITLHTRCNLFFWWMWVFLQWFTATSATRYDVTSKKKNDPNFSNCDSVSFFVAFFLHCFKTLKCITMPDLLEKSDKCGYVFLSLHLHVCDEKHDAAHSQHWESRVDQDGKSWWENRGQRVRLRKRSRRSWEWCRKESVEQLGQFITWICKGKQ